MERFKEIGFALGVVAVKEIERGAEGGFSLSVIAKIFEIDRFKIH